jgi:hypothetical protein
VELGDGGSLLFQGAAVRTIGDDFTAAEPGDAGSDSGRPTVQGLVGLTVPMGDGEVTVGAYGHAGREHLHDTPLGDDVELDTSLLGGYLRLEAGPLTLAGEGWTGSNLDDFLGGIGQGVRMDPTVTTSVGSTGGWGELAVAAAPWALHVGAGIDDPDQADLLTGMRARNEAVWGNAVRDFGQGLSAGLEVSHWATEYVGLADGSSWRIQGSMIFTF